MPLPFIIAAAAAIGSALATKVVIGGVVLTVGKLALGAAVAAATLGIAKSILDDSNEYFDENISEKQKNYEKKQLNEKLEAEKRILHSLKNVDEEELNSLLERVQGFQDKNEYFRATKIICDFKIIHAEKIKNIKLAKEIEKSLKELNEIRIRSSRL